MTWSRFSDNWCEDVRLSRISISYRWHYLCMIQYCSRSERYDGVLRRVQALRCSDIDNPEGAIQALMTLGLIEPLKDDLIRLVEIDQHVPSESQRKKTEQDKIRKRRQRAHEKGDHSMCIRESCSQATRLATDESNTNMTVTQDVTRDVGTGQDGPGQVSYQEPSNSDKSRLGNSASSWSGVSEGSFDDLFPAVDISTGEVSSDTPVVSATGGVGLSSPPLAYLKQRRSA